MYPAHFVRKNCFIFRTVLRGECGKVYMFAERAGRMAMAQGGLKAVLRLGSPAGLSRRTRRILIAAGVLALFAVVLFETYHVSFQRGKARLSDEASATAQGRAMTLSSELAKQRAVALILADDRDVIEGLSAPTPVRTDLMSRKFEDLRAQTGKIGRAHV